MTTITTHSSPEVPAEEMRNKQWEDTTVFTTLYPINKQRKNLKQNNHLRTVSRKKNTLGGVK